MAKEQAEKDTNNPKAEGKSTAAIPAGDKSNKKYGYWWGTGRRKRAIARVRIRPGKGKILINKRELENYFTQLRDKKAILSPLKAIEAEKAFDIFANVNGGGPSGQAGAVMLGIARALKSYDENYLVPLRDGDYLTRDSRIVERKKYGQRGARRRFQFSKR